MGGLQNKKLQEGTLIDLFSLQNDFQAENIFRRRVVANGNSTGKGKCFSTSGASDVIPD